MIVPVPMPYVQSEAVSKHRLNGNVLKAILIVFHQILRHKLCLHLLIGTTVLPLHKILQILTLSSPFQNLLHLRVPWGFHRDPREPLPCWSRFVSTFASNFTQGSELSPTTKRSGVRPLMSTTLTSRPSSDSIKFFNVDSLAFLAAVH
ncbi:hypothetical protein D0Y65_013281 [Glycine soja]|uniref:Uncharacterized protein n=1 Tax=Glycine soja TaxID=3848 RepID=A0A445KTR0_GLYSO|nr:hypothetical protein D0Y65_013281 [Glycine soja]